MEEKGGVTQAKKGLRIGNCLYCQKKKKKSLLFFNLLLFYLIFFYFCCFVLLLPSPDAVPPSSSTFVASPPRLLNLQLIGGKRWEKGEEQQQKKKMGSLCKIQFEKNEGGLTWKKRLFSEIGGEPLEKSWLLKFVEVCCQKGSFLSHLGCTYSQILGLP